MKGQLKPIHRSAAVKGCVRSHQCGLCHQIGADYGFRYRLFAGPDVVFYSAFMDACSGQQAPRDQRPCVLTAGVGKPVSVRQPTQRSRVAAAAGIWLGLAKIADDVQDEGTLLATAAQAMLSPAGVRARSTLSEAGFPVEGIEGWMARQRQVEATDGMAFVDSMAPTVEISGLLFGFAGVHDGPIDPQRATDIGRAIGTFLFCLDNLADYDEDLANGQYNAMASAWGRQGIPAHAHHQVVAMARAAIATAEGLLAPLDDTPEVATLRATLGPAFRLRLERVAQGIPPVPLLAQVHMALSARLTRGWQLLQRTARMQLALLLTTTPGLAWATEDWWPESATRQSLELPPLHDPQDPEVAANIFAPVGDCSNDGDFDFWDVCCFSDDCACVTACENACDDACSDACTV